MREYIYLIVSRKKHAIPLDEFEETYSDSIGREEFLSRFEGHFMDSDEADAFVNKLELEYWIEKKAELENQARFAQTEITRFEKLVNG